MLYYSEGLNGLIITKHNKCAYLNKILRETTFKLLRDGLLINLNKQLLFGLRRTVNIESTKSKILNNRLSD